MSDVIQVRFKDLDSWEQTLVQYSFYDTIGLGNLREMVCSDNRRYVRDILDKLFIYTYDTSMGYDSKYIMQELDLLDGEIKAYNTILLLMKVYMQVVKSGSRLWLNDKGVYVVRGF